MIKKTENKLSEWGKVGVQTRNAMPQYGKAWRSKTASVAGIAGNKSRWKNHVKKVKMKAKELSPKSLA